MKKVDSRLAKKIESGDFIITAELLPQAEADGSATEAAIKALGDAPLAVNSLDNPYGVALSSLAGSVALLKAGAEPVYQLVTRDRNRIALQSDLLAAAYLGIKNVLCLSGCHQTLTSSGESANVYDIDSTQLINAVAKMRDEGVLLDGTKITGDFSMLVGATANPNLRPLELNIIQLIKKVEAGASFIQTQAVFDIESFEQWLQAARKEGITEKTAILAGVLPLDSAEGAEKLRDTYTDFYIPDEVVERLKEAGNSDPDVSGYREKQEGLTMCAETIMKLKEIDGIKGVHILSGGKEAIVPELIARAGL